MAGFVSLSMSACSVDYDGNNENDADLIGTWDAISQQYYADNEGYGKPGPAGGLSICPRWHASPGRFPRR